MKKELFILIALFITVLTNAQEFEIIKTDFSKESTLKINNNLKNAKDLIYVMDSTKYFTFNDVSEEWESISIGKVVERYPNGKMRFVENANYTSLTELVNTSRTEYYYDDSYTNYYGADVFLSNVWNSDINNWQNDTAFYYNFTKYFFMWDMFGTGYLQEDKLINKDWDASTNKFTNGQKVEITLHDDSLYSDLLYVNYDVASQSWGNFDMEYSFDYNEDNNIIYILTKEWDAISSSLKNNTQFSYTYSGNNIIESIGQIWDGVIWENDYKATFDYDGNNNTVQIQYDWDDINLEWVYYDKTEYAYDMNNNKTSETISRWSSTTESWSNSEKNIFSFDTNSNKLSEAILFWNSSINNWVNEDSTYYTYDTNNNMLSKTYKKWDDTNNEWNFISKNEVSYDANNNKLSDTDLEWDDVASDWVYISRTVYFYNELNELYLEVYQQWDNTMSEWENVNREVWTFDENDNLIQDLHQTWDETAGDWKNFYKDEFYWNEFDAVNINNKNISYFNVYPNPTSDYIVVNNQKNNISSISITNVAGKIVYENNEVNSKNRLINMKQFGNGVYLVNIKDINGNTEETKILVSP